MILDGVFHSIVTTTVLVIPVLPGVPRVRKTPSTVDVVARPGGCHRTLVLHPHANSPTIRTVSIRVGPIRVTPGRALVLQSC